MNIKANYSFILSLGSEVLVKPNKIQLKRKTLSKDSNDENKLINENKVDDDLSDTLKINKVTNDFKYLKRNGK